VAATLQAARTIEFIPLPIISPKTRVTGSSGLLNIWAQQTGTSDFGAITKPV